MGGAPAPPFLYRNYSELLWDWDNPKTFSLDLGPRSNYFGLELEDLLCFLTLRFDSISSFRLASISLINSISLNTASSSGLKQTILRGFMILAPSRKALYIDGSWIQIRAFCRWFIALSIEGCSIPLSIRRERSLEFQSTIGPYGTSQTPLAYPWRQVLYDRVQE